MGGCSSKSQTRQSSGSAGSRSAGSAKHRLKGHITGPAAASTESERKCAAVRQKRDAHSLPSVHANDTIHLGLSWDKGSSRPVDLDLQCCLFDSMGLMLDACFYNNPQASGGAMRHTGDSLDGKATGEDEGVTVCLPSLPPHAYAIVCGIYCHGSGTLGQCRNVGVSACKVDPSTGQRSAPIGHAVLNEDPQATAAIVFTLQRVSAQEWTVDLEQVTMDHCRTFVDAFPAMQQLLHVDPALQEEFKSQQPVFNLKKGGAMPIPYGLTKVGFGLGWDAGCDVDASVICFSDSSHTCVYFANKEAFGAVTHSGDNLTGAGDGDDETLFIDLARIPAAVTHLFLVVNVYSAGKDFRHVKNEFARVYSNDKSKADYGMELLRVGSLDDYGTNDGVVLACLSRDKFNPAVWQFKPVGAGARARTCDGLVQKCSELKSQY